MTCIDRGQDQLPRLRGVASRLPAAETELCAPIIGMIAWKLGRRIRRQSWLGKAAADCKELLMDFSALA